MSELRSQLNSTLLAGPLCLCLALGCANQGSLEKHRLTADNLPRAACSIASGQTAYKLVAAQEGGTDTRSASLECDSHKSPDAEVVQTAWQSSEPAVEQPEPLPEVSPPNLEALPIPGNATLRRSFSLREAIDTALIQNPDAVIAQAGGPVANAGRRVAATYPWNPTVQVQVDPYTRDTAGNRLATKNQASVAQTLELAHQRRYRLRAANAGWSQERALIAQSELTAAVAAMRAYFDALYRKGLLELANNSASLQAKVVGVVDRRFAAGLASPTERITARVAARQTQRLAELAQVDYQTSLNSLRLVLNLSPDEKIEPDGNLYAYKWFSAAEALELPSAKGDLGVHTEWDDATVLDVSNRPDVIAARCAVSVAKANLDLAKANRVPNISTGPSYERDESGTLFFGLTAQMDLPVWNTGCPLVRQRSAELRQQMITWSQTSSRATLQAQAAVNRYTNAYKLWVQRQAEKDLSHQELATVADAFEQGQASIVEVLSTQNSLIQDRQNYLVLLNELDQAAADMIAALAIDPECLVESPPAVDNAGITE
jgi:outer membrane protein, heavy metal efflux system